MKKSIFLMVLLMSALHVTAQEYDPKLTIQSPREIFEATEDIYNYPYKKWFAAVDNEGKPALAYTCLTTDSVIDGRNYVASSTIPYASTFQADELVICYRQEGDKVYYYDDQQKKDILLFDFGLKEGDVFAGEGYEVWYVEEVGTFPEVAQYLGVCRNNRMFRMVSDYYKCYDMDIWVEGIGSLRYGILPRTYPYTQDYNTLSLTYHGINDHFAVRMPKFKQQPFEPIDLTMDELRELHNNGKDCPCILTATFEEDTLHLTGIMELNCNSYDMVAILTDNNHISLTIPMYEAEALACRHRCLYDIKIPGFTGGTYIIDVNEWLGITTPITLEQTRCNLTVPYCEEDAVAQYMKQNYSFHPENYRLWRFHATDADGKPLEFDSWAQKDVVLDGRTYVQFKNEYQMLSANYASGTFSPTYMRQVGKQVLRYNPDTKKETMVLDFSLDVGDEFTTETGDCMRVTEVGCFEEYEQYFYPGDGERRMLRLQGVDNPALKDVWIEGFGSTYTGVLPPEIYASYPEIALMWRSDTGNFAVNQPHYKSIPFEPEELDMDAFAALTENISWGDLPLVCEFIGNDLHISGYYFFEISKLQYAELTVSDDGTLELSFHYPLSYYSTLYSAYPGHFDLIFPDFEPGDYHLKFINAMNKILEYDLKLEEPTPYRPFIEEDKVWKVGLTNPNNNETLLNAYYYFDGDTIIDDRLCKKMMYRYEPGEEFKDDYADEVQYAGAYYEKDKLVCIAKKDWTSLGLLYDFTLNKGDEFEWNPDYSFVVKEIQMGGMEGFKGRNWTIRVTSLENEYWLDNIWMEGVGSMYTPDFDFLLPNWLMSTMTLMQCTVGDEVIYYNPDIIDGVNPPDEETKKRIDFTHVPKPRPKAPQNEAEADGDQLSGEYTLRLLDLNLGNMSDTYDVTITDDAGEVVYQKTVRTADVLALNIDISEWAAPSYTINVENDYEQYIGTFELTPTSIEEKYQEKSTKNNDIYDLQGRRVIDSSSERGGARRAEGSLPKGLYIKGGRKYLKR